MKCINHIAKAYSKENPMRSRLITSVIALTTALYLIAGTGIVMIFGYSVYGDQQIFSDYDACIEDLSNQERTQFMNQPDRIDGFALETLIGHGNLDQWLPVVWTDSRYLDTFDYDLFEGHYPQLEDEVAMTTGAAELYGLKALGDTVTIDYLDALGQMHHQTFRISGLFHNRPLDPPDHEGKVWVSEAFVSQRDEQGLKQNIYLKTKGLLPNLHSIYEMAHEAGVNYSAIYTPAMDDTTLGAWIGPFIVITALVMALGVFAIVTLFSYNVIEKMHIFGTLKAIGMTKKQIKVLLHKELKAYTPKGILLGFILAGLMISLFLLGIEEARLALTKILQVPIIPVLLICIVAITIACVYMTLWFSVRVPARKVNKQTIVESIHYVEKNKVKGQKKRNSRIKNPAIRMAIISLLSDKRRSFLTIGLLSFTVIVFIVFNMLMSSVDEGVLLRSYMPENIKIEAQAFESNIGPDLVEAIEAIEGLTLSHTIACVPGQIPVASLKVSDAYSESAQVVQSYQDMGEDAYNIFITIYNQAMGHEEDYDLDQKKVYVYDQQGALAFEPGDTLEVTVNGQTQTLTLDGIAYNYPSGSFLTGQLPINLVMDSELFKSLYGDYSYKEVYFSCDEDRLEAVRPQIAKILGLESGMVYSDINDVREDLDNEHKTVTILFYGLIVVIDLICFSMLLNSIYTSIITRKKEFGLLRSIGMTSQQIIQYLKWEGHVYILSILLVGVPIGIGIGYWNFRRLASINPHFVWSFPYMAFGIVGIYYVVIRLIVALSIRHMNHRSVVDLVRD